MKHQRTWFLAIALEAVGICVLILGIGIEVYYEADVGFIAITSGASLIALGSLLFSKVFKR